MTTKTEPLFKVVATTGRFDQLYPHDVRFLEHARTLGDELVVIMHNDFHIEKLSPFFLGKKQDARIAALEALDCVDLVIPSHHGEDFRYEPMTEISREDATMRYEIEQLMPHLVVVASGMAWEENEWACVNLDIEMKLVFMEEYLGRSKE